MTHSTISPLQKVFNIFGLATSSIFFISLIIIVILTVILIVFNNKAQSKLPKYFAAVGYLVVVVFVVLKYITAIKDMNGNFIDKIFNGNRGIIDPEKKLFPKYARNSVDIGNNKHLVISGGITKLSKTSGIFRFGDILYPMEIDQVNIKKKIKK